MNLLHPISTIMSKDVKTLTPTNSIADASDMFSKNKIHHIPIVKDDKLVGIVSKSDYLFFKRGFLNDRDDDKIEEIRMQNYEVSYIMTKGIAKLEPTDRINVALEIFKENIFHAIPVVDEGRLVGIVTTFDIINHLASDNEAHMAYDLHKS